MSSRTKYLNKVAQLIRKKGFAAVRNPIGAYREFVNVNNKIEVSKELEAVDYSSEDLLQNEELMKKFSQMKKVQVETINWFVPVFEHPFAGILTILRAADYFLSQKGIRNRFIFYGEQFSPSRTKKAISIKFPSLSSEEMLLLQNNQIDALPYADISIATRWDSASRLLRFNKTKGKFYFMQDYEPLFYPAGSLYASAESTYSFGFYGIINTPGLYDIYVNVFKGVAEYFVPSVDPEVFFPVDREVLEPSAEKPFTIFFYARPTVPRNGFELGISSLKKIKAKYGKKVRIYAAGTYWNPRDYGLENVITVLGTLPYEETANLYRKSDLGLVFMFTKHPSYLPFELMACGCPVVTNKNPANFWFLKDQLNCLLTEPTITCTFEKIDRLMNNLELRKLLIRGGINSVKGTNWESQMENVYKFITRS